VILSPVLIHISACFAGETVAATPPPEAPLHQAPLDRTQATERVVAYAASALSVPTDQVGTYWFGDRSGAQGFGYFLAASPRFMKGAVLVHADGVWKGPESFPTYVAAFGRDSPAALASAWLVLGLGIAGEPRGSWTIGAPAPDPTLAGDVLTFSYADPRGNVKVARVRLNADGTAVAVP
jgi:hypothetical protein